MYDDRLGFVCGLLDPEAPKEGELLAFRFSSIDSEATRGSAIDLSSAKCPEVARSLKDGELIVMARRVDGG